VGVRYWKIWGIFGVWGVREACSCEEGRTRTERALL